MTESPIEICNRALDTAGARSTISSFTDPTPSAQACQRWYNSTRRSLLRTANWGFATLMVSPALLKSAPGTPENPSPTASGYWDPANPPQGWLYEFAYPNSALRLQNVRPQVQPNTGFAIPIFSTPSTAFYSTPQGFIRFAEIVDRQTVNQGRQQFKAMVCNANPCLLTYTLDVVDTSIWDAMFIDAFVYALAGRITPGLSGEKNDALTWFKLANSLIMEARAADANEMTTIDDTLPDWLAARGDGSPGSPYLGASGWLFGPYGGLFGS